MDILLAVVAVVAVMVVALVKIMIPELLQMEAMVATEAMVVLLYPGVI
ncbi:hypothetical protein C4A64_02802 [Escherichia coli]|nr:hypothetical protein C4A66_02944 [Escherichia coli]RDP02442.1 hypothetical protein C4A64_02802 [Escherichia coli]